MSDSMEERAVRIAAEPENWLGTAAMLKRSADQLAPVFQGELQALVMHPEIEGCDPPPPLGPVYMMLAGLALENLAKGLIVSSNADSAERLTQKARHLDERLLSEAGVELVDSEPELVRRLRVFLTFAGRYPVPLAKHAAALAHRGIVDNPMRYSTNDVILFDALYKRVEQRLSDAVTSSGNAVHARRR